MCVQVNLEMAFCNKLSGFLRQGVSQSSNVPVTSMLGSLRYMSTKLFVGGKYVYNCKCLPLLLQVFVSLKCYVIFTDVLFHVHFLSGLSWGTDEQSLKDAFSNFGEVTEGKPHWFCLV